MAKPGGPVAIERRVSAGNNVTAATIEANIAAAVAAKSAKHSRFSVSNEHRVLGIVVGLGLVLAASTFYVGLASHDRVFTQTKTVKLTVEQQLGKPAQTVDGARVNRALAGFTCLVYQAKAVVLCHR